MLCPECEKVVRFSAEEKELAKKNGEVFHTCCSCGFTFRAKYCDTLKNREKQMYLRDNGICIYCATRPAQKGYISCDICRLKVGTYRSQWFGSIVNEVEKEKQEEKKKKYKSHKMTLDEISIAAAKEHMSYGQYVAKYGL